MSLLTAFWLKADPGSALTGAAAPPPSPLSVTCSSPPAFCYVRHGHSGASRGSAFGTGLLAATGGDADAKRQVPL